MPISRASKVAKSLVGLAVAAALLVVSSHQLAAQSVSEPGGIEVICLIASDVGSGLADHTACGYAATGSAHCLADSGCSAFTMPTAYPFATLRRAAGWLTLWVRGLAGRIVPLETPPPIIKA